MVPIFNNLVSVGFHGYNIPNIKALARGGSTNHAFNTAYRGFGSPQIYTTTEALIDMAAEKAGIDPWEFRYKNAARPGDLTINSRPYHDYVYPDAAREGQADLRPVQGRGRGGQGRGQACGRGHEHGRLHHHHRHVRLTPRWPSS